MDLNSTLQLCTQRGKITKAHISDTTVGAIITDFMAKHQGQVLFWLFVGVHDRLGRLSLDQTAQELASRITAVTVHAK